MIALALLTIGVLGLNSMQSSSVLFNSTASGMTEAVTSGSNRLEDFFVSDYDALEAGSVGGVANGQFQTFNGNTVYTVSWIANFDDPMPRTARVIVQAFRENFTNPRVVEFEYIISKGIQ